MAERDELAGLPGVWELGWWLLMRPFSLNHRLQSLPTYSVMAMGTRVSGRLRSVYVARMATLLLVGMPALTVGAILLVAASGFHVDPARLAVGVALGEALGVVVGAVVASAFDVAFAVAVGVAFGVTVGVAVGVADGAAVSAAVRLAANIAARTTDLLVTFVAIVVFFGVVIGVVFGLNANIANGDGMVVGMVSAAIISVSFVVGILLVCIVLLVGAAGMVVGIPVIVAYLGLRFCAIELPWQLIAFIIQRTEGKITLAWSPALHHEINYVPLPTLARHILETAKRDPTLARRALHACALASGQRRVGRRALAHLRARELTDLANRRAFQSLRDLRGNWLPDPAAADGTFAALQEVGRYLRSAELTLLPDQQREQLLAARDRLHGLDNALLGGRDLESPIYRQAVAQWRWLVDAWLAETQVAAALVLPNPFRAGDPLDLEFGREVFRGREDLVAELESILGDPNRGASMALIGPRRCGKTSLLRMLPLKLPDAQVVFFDVQANPIDSPTALVGALVQVAQEQARRERRLRLPDLPPGPPMEALHDWLARLEGFAGIGRILICIDEFERWADLFPGDRRALLQFLGLIRATIQHRRRVRILISGATPLDELEPLWADHFVNLRQLAIGHLTRPVVLDLLTRPSPAFPTDAIPNGVAEAVWARTLGQPYLTQLFGQLIVAHLNAAGRRQAEVEDCAVVEPQLLDQAGSPYLSYIVQAAPEPVRRALESLARGEPLDLDALDRPTRRYLRRRSLVTETGGLGIPVLGAYLERED